jgi:predicted acylesterase/phospholipase RssA
MTIKHFVISGGGPILFEILSSIQELEKQHFFTMKDIETIYGTSAGAIIAVMISLQFEWETINDYIIKRPWREVFPINAQNIFDIYTKKGLFDIKTIEKCFKPLFDAKNISLHITLAEFYELTKIDIHIFSFEINEYKIQDISHTTHPTLEILTAIQMSCALPILVTPVFMDDNKCFIDGGVGCNYPLQFCIESGKNPDEIIGFKSKCFNDKSKINSESTIVDYLLNFLFKAVFNANNNYIEPIIKNELVFDTNYLTLDMFKKVLNNIEDRRELFEKGKQTTALFLQNRI